MTRSLLLAIALSTAVGGAAHTQIPSACYRDLLSAACEDALERQRDLDNLRSGIDSDARMRQDDRDFFDWFDRMYNEPAGGRSAPRSAPRPYNPYDELFPTNPRRR